MIPTGDSTHRNAGPLPLVFDASPLIYLAKSAALDVIHDAGYRPLIPSSVAAETTSRAMTYRHPDAVRIAERIRTGSIEVIEPTDVESVEAARIARMAGGMHAAECEVLSLGLTRRVPVVVFERQARRVAVALGLAVVDVVELVFAGTSDPDVLATRIRCFAELIQMRAVTLEALLAEVERRRS